MDEDMVYYGLRQDHEGNWYCIEEEEMERFDRLVEQIMILELESFENEDEELQYAIDYSLADLEEKLSFYEDEMIDLNYFRCRIN